MRSIHFHDLCQMGGTMDSASTLHLVALQYTSFSMYVACANQEIMEIPKLEASSELL